MKKIILILMTKLLKNEIIINNNLTKIYKYKYKKKIFINI